MRPDMYKTIGQPRSRKSIRKPGRSLPFDIMPRRKGFGKAVPYFYSGVHVGTLKRWLRSRLGKSWNKTYSELAAVADNRSWPKARLRHFILKMVERDVVIRDGELWIRRERWGTGEEVPITKAADYGAVFYVHPRTGLLHEAPRYKRF